MTKMSRRLVVDASVARSAGTTENPRSILCRDFLDIMRKVRHRLVMTPEIQRAWLKHCSGYATVWLAAMRRRNLVVSVSPDADFELMLVELLEEAPHLSAKQKAAIRKDLLLVVAACQADQIIASGDDKMRDLLGGLANQCHEIAQTIWVNPAVDQDVHAWLKAGARNDPARLLGAVTEKDSAV